MSQSDRSAFAGIRITSDPDTTRIEQPAAEGAAATRTSPLRLLLAADLAPHGDPDWTSGRRLVPVDKYRFAGLFEHLAPWLDVEVPNRVGETPKLLDVSLRFRSLKDFGPEQVARQVPVLAQLLDLRGLVDRLCRKEIDAETFRARLGGLGGLGVDAEWTRRLASVLAAPPRPSSPTSSPARPASPAPGSDALDRLFGMVDTGGGAAPGAEASETAGEPSGLMGSLFGAAAGRSSERPPAGAAAEELLADLDATIGKQLNAVLNHPDVRRLEAAWRGLKFLVDRIDFRAGVELEVLPVCKAEVDDALYHQVLHAGHGSEIAAPPHALIVLDFAFDAGRADVALLEELAATAASLQTPVLASVSPAFFDVEQEAGLARLPLVWQHLEQPAYLAWNKLRDLDAAQYLALALPAFLLRAPYGADHPAGALRFDEEGRLWGGAALAVAAAAAESFARTGWPTHLADVVLGDLPVWQSPAGAIPLAAALATEKQAELADAGFVVLGCRTGKDTARVVHAPVLRRAVRGDTEAAMHTSLPAQLFVSRAAHFLLDYQNALTAPADLDAVQVDVGARLRTFLRIDAGEAESGVSVVPLEAGSPGYDVLVIRLEPPRDVLDLPVRLTLGLQVPRHGAGAHPG